MKILVCLRDKKADLYLAPFVVPTMGVAFRSVSDEISRGGDGNALSSHPADFQLWQLGRFDEASGVIEADKSCVCEVESLILDK